MSTESFEIHGQVFDWDKVMRVIDTSDIREMTAKDFARGRKNPFADKIRKHGFTISVSERFSANDVIDIANGTCSRFQLSAEELEALEEYEKANANA